MGSSTPRSFVLALLALLGPAACQAKIGEECLRSTDCSIRGERICDLSHRVNDEGVVTPSGKGECTIDGCGSDSCPKEAACIKVYGSDFLSVACDPEREDLATTCEFDDEEGKAACMARGCLPPVSDCDWICPTAECCEDDPSRCEEQGCYRGLVCPPRDDCEARQVCLSEGLCADEITARTSCRRKCSNDNDCRNGYECVETGSQGVYRAPDIDNPDPGPVRICMPER